MPVRITPEAVEVIDRSLKLAPEAGGVRLRLVAGRLMPRLARGPEPGDVEVLDRVWADPSIDGEVAVSEEHDTLVLR